MTGPVVWVARHGQTEWSAAGRHTSRTDVPLTAAGQQEAIALGKMLQSESFDLVESSPRQRAVRTAELAGFKPVIDNNLVEWDYGELEGLTTDQIRADYPGWDIWNGPWTGGETNEQVAARADKVVQRARALPPGAKALLFSHGHLLRVLAARWLGQPSSSGRFFMLGTATLSVLGWERGGAAVEHWNVPPGHAPGSGPAPGPQ
ncbi:MAG TPA: histidine phosphatase family protein [Acidimicrobiales bacterium]|nr:histidine phosphatase family protein [Acidimicrobiales bacterium]